MSGRWLRALRAAVLAAAVLSGGGGMPLLDVLLYHGLGPSRSAQPHYEPSGVHCHGELCKLDSRFPSSTGAESLDPRIQVLTTPFRELPLATLGPRPANVGLLPHPRAPPALPA